MPQIIPIKDLKKTSEISEMCHTTNEPVFITKNGYGDMVIMSMEAYEETMKKLDIYTDGACSGNPGSGGYGVVMLYKGARKELSQGYKTTTNNRMEALAVIKALEALKEPCEVTLYSDSKYVVDSITKGWVYNWKKKNWIKSDKKKALNVDLWERLLPLLEKHNVEFVWVKGHADNVENERCDELARMAIASGNLLEDENYRG